jgi:hypothetical protein
MSKSHCYILRVLAASREPTFLVLTRSREGAKVKFLPGTGRGAAKLWRGPKLVIGQAGGRLGPLRRFAPPPRAGEELSEEV